MANCGPEYWIEAKDLKTYIKKKIEMLEKDFCIRLTNTQIRHFYELKTEIAVDNYAIQVIADN